VCGFGFGARHSRQQPGGKGCLCAGLRRLLRWISRWRVPRRLRRALRLRRVALQVLLRLWTTHSGANLGSKAYRRVRGGVSGWRSALLPATLSLVGVCISPVLKNVAMNVARRCQSEQQLRGQECGKGQSTVAATDHAWARGACTCCCAG
jgi:hypothetical protein